MATVFIQTRKRKNRNSYVIYYKDPLTGSNRYYKTLPKKKEAQATANDLRILLDNGELPSIRKKRQKLKPMTVNQIADHLSELWNEKILKCELKQTTLDDYQLRIERIRKKFGNRLLLEISKSEILEYRAQLATNISNATSNRYMFILKQVFKTGYGIRAILEDPTNDISYLSEEAHERKRFLFPDEIEKLVVASQKTRAKYYMPALIYLGAEHGASRQEALSLRWTDINFDFEEVGLIQFFRTKNSRQRTEFLMPRARESLIEWRDHQALMRHRKRIEVKDSGFVFCRLTGEPFKRFDSAWRRICKLAKIENFHYHDLRHTFCSNLLMSGSNLKDVMDMIGHSDIATTNRYSHLPGIHKKNRQIQLANHYSRYSKKAKL